MMRTLLSRKKYVGFRDIIDSRIASRTGRKAPVFRDNRDHPLAIFANDYIGIMVNEFGIYERNELDLIFDLIKSLDGQIFSGTAIDIGANIGNHACAFAKQFSRVFAFEPNPLVFQLLTFNAQFHPNMVAGLAALGDHPGVARMKINHSNLGGSFISEDGDIDVTVFTIDALSEKYNFDRVTFIKIDVEGFEVKVLKGAQHVIRYHQPLICFEQNSRDFQNGSSSVIDLLTEHGYRFCWIEVGRRSISNRIVRKFFMMYDLIFGSVDKIVIGDTPPPRFHSMIVAVPQRYSALL